jgi:cytosine deaminase
MAPGWYCSGLVQRFRIGTVVVGESVNFAGAIEWLRGDRVDVVDRQSRQCIDVLAEFIRRNPGLWNEDIGGE